MARDHGGGVDAAVAKWGGHRSDWVDLSTGINPVPYPVGDISAVAWNTLPDSGAMDRLITAAREFWNVPEGAEILPANGASALITRMPSLSDHDNTYIPTPTYNEHAAAFEAAGKLGHCDMTTAASHVYVHPNNPDGKLWSSDVFGDRSLTVIDESFCDVWPEQSHIARAADEGIVILKSFGKFWGLAGLRLGFMIAAPSFIDRMKALQEPWSVNGPALEIGARALRDTAWAAETRDRLNEDAQRLDNLMLRKGAKLVGGTPLFRLYNVDDAAHWQNRLAENHVWSRIFPYSKTWIRLGLPAPDQWDQLEAAL